MNNTPKIERLNTIQRDCIKFRKRAIYSPIDEKYPFMSAENGSSLNIDKLDLELIQQLSQDAGRSYAEMGKQLFVSAGTVHVRIKKLQEAGILGPMRMQVDFKKLGYGVIAFIGIYLEKSSLYDVVARELRKIPEIVRLNYTTGNYSIFAEVVCRDIESLRSVLHDELQKIKGIERTETFLSLEESLNRPIRVTPGS